MHDPRINTYAALTVVLLFGLGAVFVINRAIDRVDWQYLDAAKMQTDAL